MIDNSIMIEKENNGEDTMEKPNMKPPKKSLIIYYIIALVVVVMLNALVMMSAILFIVMNLLTDIAYAWADPRIKLE